MPIKKKSSKVLLHKFELGEYGHCPSGEVLYARPGRKEWAKTKHVAAMKPSISEMVRRENHSVQSTVALMNIIHRYVPRRHADVDDFSTYDMNIPSGIQSKSMNIEYRPDTYVNTLDEYADDPAYYFNTRKRTEVFKQCIGTSYRINLGHYRRDVSITHKVELSTFLATHAMSVLCRSDVMIISDYNSYIWALIDSVATSYMMNDTDSRKIFDETNIAYFDRISILQKIMSRYHMYK